MSGKEEPDMDQIKTGKFIASRRKERGMTQATLAEILGISDRAVSKWETGRSLPDSGIMLELCGLLKINVNELLSGEKIDMDTYDKHAEENLISLKKENEDYARRLLTMEMIIGCISTVSFLGLIFTASFIQMAAPARIILIALGAVVFVVGVGACILIEQKAGYYECRCCRHKYVPAYKQVFFSMHIGRTRYMKCPECGKRSWQKKVLTKDE
jgi:transcriptional regulator with XRE-family HTH domain